ELAFGRRHVARHHDLDRDELIAGGAALEPRHAIAGKPERAPARRRGRNLHRDLAAQGRHLERRPERGFGCRHREAQMDVVALALEERVRRHRDAQVEITARSRGAGAFAGDAHALIALHARGNFHAHMPPHRLRTAAPALWTRLALDLPGSLTGLARLL